MYIIIYMTMIPLYVFKQEPIDQLFNVFIITNLLPDNINVQSNPFCLSTHGMRNYVALIGL